MPIDKKKLERMKVRFDYPVFNDWERPNGFLCNHKEEPACHACMYYAMLATKAYQKVELREEIQLEDAEGNGPLWNQTNYQQQIESISAMYGVPMERIVNHWHCVQMQFHLMNWEILPEGEKYRHDAKMKVH